MLLFSLILGVLGEVDMSVGSGEWFEFGDGRSARRDVADGLDGPVRHVVVGVAGAGKTSYAMDLMERKLREGLKIGEIGFASFSRAACREAAVRAAKITGEDETRLQRDLWFRTVHSAAFRLLGIGKDLVLDVENAKGRQFLEEHVGAAPSQEPGTVGWFVGQALQWWGKQRSLVVPLFRCSPDRDLGDEDRSEGSDRWPDGPDGHGRTARPGVARSAVREKSNVFIGQSDAAARAARQIDESVRSVSPCDSTSYVEMDSTFTHIGQNQKSISPTFVLRKVLSAVHFCDNPICDKELRADSTLNESGRSGRNLQKHWSYHGQTAGHPNLPGRKFGETTDQKFMLELIQKYEAAKRLYGRLDFTDLLFRYVGLEVCTDLTVVQVTPTGSRPEEVNTWIFDEYQDSSVLLDMVAERLAEVAGEVWYLGDRYQAVYGFSGAQASVFAAHEDHARGEGRRVLLNRTWRNPCQVVEWGEAILKEDQDYESREPISESDMGSVGLMDWQVFLRGLKRLAGTDTMILARTWFALGPVKQELNSLGIPWRSAQEDQSSQWECPAKIAYVLTMRAIVAGEEISEQDWRRVTETLPAKWEGKELFVRGTKAKWKKAECSPVVMRRMNGLLEWGATEVFLEFVESGKWKSGVPLLLDHAIETYGVNEVREPRIRLGSCHSVKGMEAWNVFCLAASSKMASENADAGEEICLKYVTITRAEANYRLVVDQNDVARGKPMFWAAPRGEKGYVDDSGRDWKGICDSGGDCEPLGEDRGGLDREVSGRDSREGRDAGSAGVRQGEVRGAGSEEGRGKGVGDSEVPGGEDQECWWSF